jgi:replicative DNA helicase
MSRLASKMSGVDSTKIKKGSITDEEMGRINTAFEDMQSLPIYIEDEPGIHVNKIVAKATSYWRKHGIRRIYVDYLQLCTGDGDIREQEISHISRTLKGLAKRLKLPLMALSQLNRSVETRGGSKKPMLSDLRESGAIEQDADMVLFLYRPEYYKILEDEEGNNLQGIGEIIVAKNRNGVLDSVTAKFDGPTMSWKDRDETSVSLKDLKFSGPTKPSLIPVKDIEDEMPF